MAADITVADDCARIVKEAVTRYGRLDILINNVGIGGGGDAPAHRIEEQVLDRILDVNLKGMWQTIKAAIPVMRSQKAGSIVNISSLAATSGHSSTRPGSFLRLGRWITSPGRATPRAASI